MKQRFRFVSGEVKLFIPRTVEFEAESKEEAEDFLVEHLRQFGEVYSVSSFVQEESRD